MRAVTSARCLVVAVVGVPPKQLLPRMWRRWLWPPRWQECPAFQVTSQADEFLPGTNKVSCPFRPDVTETCAALSSKTTSSLRKEQVGNASSQNSNFLVYCFRKHCQGAGVPDPWMRSWMQAHCHAQLSGRDSCLRLQ